MVMLSIMTKVLEGGGQHSSPGGRGDIWDGCSPSSGVRIPATHAPCGHPPFLICKLSGFGGDRLREWGGPWVVLRDRYTGAGKQSRQQAWPLRLYFWTPAIFGCDLLILQMGKLRLRWGRPQGMGDRGFRAIPGSWAPPHTMIPAATAPFSFSLGRAPRLRAETRACSHLTASVPGTKLSAYCVISFTHRQPPTVAPLSHENTQAQRGEALAWSDPEP